MSYPLSEVSEWRVGRLLRSQWHHLAARVRSPVLRDKFRGERLVLPLALTVKCTISEHYQLSTFRDRPHITNSSLALTFDLNIISFLGLWFAILDTMGLTHPSPWRSAMPATMCVFSFYISCSKRICLYIGLVNSSYIIDTSVTRNSCGEEIT